MKRQLVEGPAIPVYKSLAVKVGLLEAVFLQQLHFKAQISPTTAEGHKWFQCTTDKWLIQLPFVSKSTIERLIKSLHARNLIDRKRVDHKGTYYRVRYDELQRILGVDITPV